MLTWLFGGRKAQTKSDGVAALLVRALADTYNDMLFDGKLDARTLEAVHFTFSKSVQIKNDRISILAPAFDGLIDTYARRVMPKVGTEHATGDTDLAAVAVFAKALLQRRGVPGGSLKPTILGMDYFNDEVFAAERRR